MGTLQNIYTDLKTMKMELVATYRTKELIRLVKQYEETTNSKFIDAKSSECIRIAKILRKKVMNYRRFKVILDIIKILMSIHYETKKPQNPRTKGNKGNPSKDGKRVS